MRSLNYQGRANIRCLFLFLALSCFGSALLAQSPTLPTTVDPSFHPGTGADNDVFAIAVQSDGKILIGGQFGLFNGTNRNRIARLHLNGTLDLSFDPNNSTSSSGSIYGLAVQPDGKILVAGGFFGTGDHSHLMRLLPGGGKDPAFTPASINNELRAVVLQPDGRILIAGRFTSVGGQMRGRVARLNADGSLDPTFDPGSGANDHIRAMALQSDGSVLVGGQFTSVNGQPRGYLARMSSTGTLDSAFTPTISGEVRTIALHHDGRIVIGGEFSTVNTQTRTHVAQVLTDGSLDPNFAAVTLNNTTVRTVVTQADGMVWLGGDFTALNGAAAYRIARLTGTGQPDTVFNPGFSGPANEVFAIALQSDGKPVIGGQFTTVSGAARQRVARLFKDTSVQSFDFVTSQFQAGESDGTAFVFINRKGATNVTSAVDFTTDDDTALAGSDYLPVLSRVEFQPGEVTKSVAITILNDPVIGPNTQLKLTLSNPSPGSYLGPIFQSVLQIEERTALLEFTQSLALLPENQTNYLQFFLRRSGWLNTSVTVGCAGFSGTAMAGADFVRVTNYVTFRAGEWEKIVAVPVINDGEVEQAEEFDFRIVAIAGLAAPGPRSNITIRILDNDRHLTFTQAAFSGSERQGHVGVQLRRGDDGTNVATVLLKSTSGTAVAGQDFVTVNSSNGWVILQPGEMTKSFLVPVVADCVGEVDETFSLSMVSASPGTAWDPFGPSNSATLTITDDTIPGARDYSFQPPANLKAPMQMLPDGRILATKQIQFLNGSYDELVRLLPNGSIDPLFRARIGTNQFISHVTALALQPDGRILVGGWRHMIDTFSIQGVLRLNSDGSDDTNFTRMQWMGVVAPQTQVIAVDPSGKILVGGQSLPGNTGLLRLQANGTPDTNFIVTIISWPSGVSSMQLQENGRIVIGGTFTNIHGSTRNRIARLNGDGTLDPTFDPGAGPNGPVLALVPAQRGSQLLLIGGQFSMVGNVPRAGVARLHPDGSLDESFSPGTNSGPPCVTTLAAQHDGRIWIGGSQTSFDGIGDGLVRVESTGAVDVSSVADTFTVGGLALAPDGAIIAVQPPPPSSISAAPGEDSMRRYLNGITVRVRLVERSPSGNQLELIGPSLRLFTVQSSEDLQTWRGIGEVQFQGCPILFNDPELPTANGRFYRLRDFWLNP